MKRPRSSPSSAAPRAALAEACGHPECYDPARHDVFWTPPTMVTFVRTAAGVVLAALALFYHSPVLLYASLAVYWAGDMLDGALARRLGCETRTGAVLDIVCDRINSLAFYGVFAVFYPEMALPIGLFVFEFAVLDLYLSLAFLRWPIHSPNYFYAVDRLIWLLNWSRTGKAVNSAGLILLVVVCKSALLGALFVAGLIILKIYSLVRLARVPGRAARGDGAVCLIGRPLG